MVFHWAYFFYFVVGMLFLYWVVFVLGLLIKSRLKNIDGAVWFKKDKGISGYFVGTILGGITPFCSCSTIPVFIGLIESEIPLGYAISFLISSPTIDPVAIILFLALFGWKLTLLYIGTCFVISVVGGMALSHKGLHKYVNEVFIMPEDENRRFHLGEATQMYFRFLRSLFPILLFAGTIAGFLKGWIPSESFLTMIAQNKIIAIPSFVFLGGIIYTDIGMLVPVGKLLLSKGVNAGVVFSFMMAASGVGIPCIILLSRVFKKPLLFMYLSLIFLLFTSTGYFFSWII